MQHVQTNVRHVQHVRWVLLVKTVLPVRGGMCITFLGCTGAEYVKINNNGNASQNLAGWKIGLKNCNTCKEVKYTLPAKTVQSKSFTRIFFKAGKSSCPYVVYLGVPCKDCLKCSGQTVNLYNKEGVLVSSKTN